MDGVICDVPPARGTRAGAAAPQAQRAHALRVGTGSTT